MQKMLICNAVKYLCVFIALLVPLSVQGFFGEQSANTENNDIIDVKKVIDTYPFFGLASFYNQANFFVIDGSKIKKIKDHTIFTLNDDEQFAAVGRYKSLLIHKPSLKLSIDDDKVSIEDRPPSFNPKINIVNNSEFNALRYAHLAQPLQWLALLVESLIVKIYDILVQSWGVSIIILAVLIKLIMWPLTLIIKPIKEKTESVQSQLAPILKDIKANYDGEVAHQKIMQAHKDLGVTPFYTIKPMLGLLLNLPIWIVVFNVLGQMPNFQGQSFLWINDLAYPDALFNLGFTIPLVGNTFNALPFLMCMVSIAATLMQQPAKGGGSNVLSLHLVTILCFVLFYPFPAAMVLYWTVANALSIVEYCFKKKAS